MPKAKRLQDWYRALLTAAKARRVVEDWCDLNDFVPRAGIHRARDVSPALLRSPSSLVHRLHPLYSISSQLLITFQLTLTVAVF